MSRSGYSYDYEEGGELWRGAVASAINGRRGQKLLRELAAAMDAMPERLLIADNLEHDGQYCALGVIGKAKGIDMSNIDPEDFHLVAKTFDIARAMAQEIEFENDEAVWTEETPNQRWTRMRKWVDASIRKDTDI